MEGLPGAEVTPGGGDPKWATEIQHQTIVAVGSVGPALPHYLIFQELLKIEFLKWISNISVQSDFLKSFPELACVLSLHFRVQTSFFS